LRDATEFRWYLFGSDTAARIHRVDNVVVNGETRALASLAAQAADGTPRRVFQGTADIQLDASITNDALAAGTQATRSLEYTIGLSGDGLSSSATGGTLAGGATAGVAIDVDTSTAGLKQGTLNVSSSNAWRAGGVAGANSVAVSLAPVTVLDHSDAAFGLGDDTLEIDFGTHALGSGPQSQSFSLENLLATAGFTAALDLDSITASGDTGAFSTDLQTFSNLAAGESLDFEAVFDASAVGNYSATYTLLLSDEDGIEGDEEQQELTLTLTGSVFDVLGSPNANDAVPLPEPSSLLILAGLSLLAFGRRTTRRRAG
jgi:hypothetical protein